MTRLSSTAREKLYDAEVMKAKEAGLGNYPICKLCCLPITPGQRWDTNHEAHKPRWLGGAVDGISHARCNRSHNNSHDTPLFHKNNRQRQQYIGAKRPAQPMRGSRDDQIKIRMNKPPVYRDSGRPVFQRPWIKQL